ncbi:hypothetical protein BG015_010495 [Linnemannia schmuckeri]|uniref:Uncharacterized protein n=1 Tax=Linnemannia schmuckeri TaxID=64567 RepID=A0A9P5RTX6_9FUNG|nr:hypothetical protein BG015_010495 [Linnemannia schmuckeri]
MMTPPALSLMFQFPAVRSLIFRGPCILPGVLEFLPNLDSLSLLPSPSGYGSSRSSSTSVPIKTRTSRSSPPSPSSASLFLEMSQILHDKCLHITKLVLTEPSVMGDSSTVMHLPVLLQTMPGRLVHVELALRGSRGDGYGEREVLRLELEELSGAGAMDADEEAVMEMFVKSLFIRSRTPVSVPMSEDVDVEDVMETSDVGESSSWSAGPTNDVDEVSSGGSSFPLRHSPASSGSTTSWATSSSSGGLTNALPVRHTPPAPSLLDETGLASASQSPSSSLSSWTTRSGSFGNRAPSTTSTESSPSGASVQYEGQSQRREAQQQRVLGQSFAMTTSPMSLKSVSTASSTSTATTSSVASKAGESMRGSYFPPHTPGTPSSSFSSAYTTSPVSSLSKSTPSSSQSQGQSQSSQDDRRSREAVSAFLSSCSNYQVDAVGRLMALQFLVEYQLASLPRLECFWLGSKMFRIPRRRSSSSSSSS